MKKQMSPFAGICVLCLVFLCACTAVQSEDSGPTWQEQYDLGVRYLSEGNYQEAIIAFTAAIEIDPKQAPAYVGRGDAYVLSGKTEPNLAAAKADYEKALELEESSADAWLRLVDIYTIQGDYTKAMIILEEALGKVTDKQQIINRIAEITDLLQADNEYSTLDDFQVFDTFTQEQQKIIATMTEIVSTGDFLSLIHLPYEKVISFDNWYHYTIFNGYKLSFRLWTYDEAGSSGNYFVMIRPENGMGYFLSIDFANSVEHKTIKIFSSPCIDWIPNGELQSSYIIQAGELLSAEIIKGTVVNGIRTGEFLGSSNVEYSFDGNWSDIIWDDFVSVDPASYVKYSYPDTSYVSWIGEGINDEEDYNALFW